MCFCGHCIVTSELVHEEDKFPQLSVAFGKDRFVKDGGFGGIYHTQSSGSFCWSCTLPWRGGWWYQVAIVGRIPITSSREMVEVKGTILKVSEARLIINGPHMLATVSHLLTA